jgi:hypothetical protein
MIQLTPKEIDEGADRPVADAETWIVQSAALYAGVRDRATRRFSGTHPQ